ncbi:cobaltochelatase subunit CobN [Azoarcus olearius]|uniref:cobaltochelatase subunit CobN n=1 Tax=Azoarcus sp. (strain BH72) TaxID=418699 RepID=UPI000806298F|nr:cobaltochelatase subunit CobN [Azoarcus olearius]ANQ85815.1 cobaltochelatase subunit CobN [Azoarcus olearius]
MTRLARRWRAALACALLCLCGLAQARPTLLWINADITPAARVALVAREAEAADFNFRKLEYRLQGGPLSAAQQAELEQALAGAQRVWVDAPHATAEARLRTVLAEPLGRHAGRLGEAGVLWITAGEPAAGDTSLRAYLQAGGPANTRNAFALARAQLAGTAAPAVPPPALVPQGGLYHPDAPALFANAQHVAAWAAAWKPARPAVALLLHRYHFVQGNTAWLDDWLRRFERQGITAYAVFSSHLSDKPLADLLEVPGADGARTLHPRLIVTHTLLPQGATLQPVFERWGVPVLATQPYRQGDTAAWEASPTGLSQGDVAYYFAQPEAAGTIDPVLVVAHPPGGAEPQLIARQADAVVAKAARLIRLQTTPAAAKRLVAMVYNYPPGGGNFGASFLNVPRSLENVSGELQRAGYAVTPLPEADWIRRLQPLIGAYYPNADLRALLASDQAAALPLADYQAWFDRLPQDLRRMISARWGEPAESRYLVEWQGRRVFVIPRVRAGALDVLPQPPREETLRQGQDPFMHKSRTPISHHYLATYLWAQQADALIHFGTHGTQEWAPGKLRGLDVHDQAWLPLGDLPVIYPYIVDNLGEATTAKRRGRALMISHRTPGFSPAGFNKRMGHMHELMHEWETADVGPTRSALEQQLIAVFVEQQLHRDLGWTAERIAADFAGFLEQLHPWLDRLAQSSQPKGLAVFGRVPDAADRHQTILQMLREPLIEALGEDIDEAFLIDHERVAGSRPSRWLEVALQDAEAASRLDLRPPEPEGPVPNRAARKAIDSEALRELALRAQEMERRLAIEGELPGLLAALDGRFVPAAYGGDPLRNPDSVPTGRNLTGLDPSRLPTRQAYDVARKLFAAWYAEQAAAGRAPQRFALSLWAGETLRHQGVMEAQALVALGVEPVWDANGRPNGVRVLPQAELGRPRVDVLLSITGSYRDQFPALMNLIDQGVAAAATAEPDNAVARNTRTVQAELRKAGIGETDAAALAQARVFGNAAGDYGTGVADAVQSNGLKAGDERLGELFLQRMSQPYVNGEPMALSRPDAAAQALGAHLRHTDAALMSRTSHLYAMVSSDDPFQYLGGLAAAARSAGKREALELHVSQLQDGAQAFTETASRSIALEMQSRYLHPGWLKAQREEGWAGTLQVLKAVQYSFGWQNTAPDTVRPDHWQSFHDVLVRDRHQLGLPEWLRQNPQAYAQALERLIQADRLGYWKPDAETRKELAGLYRELSREAPLGNELTAVRQWAADQLPQPVVQQARAVQSQPAPPAQSEQKPAEVEPAPMQRGVKLEAVPEAPKPEKVSPSNPLSMVLAVLAMTLVLAAGAVWQGRARRPAAN